ncbi:hypothetical protein SH591_08785 [Sphingomonas sp. LY54]|uniref:thermonuclease family protein n=1 Tax=Sphingomonas sp. LY54 TaxID=3095343 RepID=UPI002D78D737|nr:hypothetical protein [Sphingomonas sp. LY54]WRP27219.1 hypothetical protein SH591_08785 [Sphingomonas sp. LY54]
MMRLNVAAPVGIAAAALAGFLLIDRGGAESAVASGAVPIVATGTRFSCTPVAVWDGDGPIWCAEGPRVRLEGIAAQEIDGTCRPGHPCPKASGLQSRDYLVRLLGGPKGVLSTGHVAVNGPRLYCVSGGNAKGKRTAAFCSAPRVGDLSCSMVKGGYALRWSRYGGDGVCRQP